MSFKLTLLLKGLIVFKRHNTNYVILNSVRQHNYFIIQRNYVGYMFRL